MYTVENRDVAKINYFLCCTMLSIFVVVIAASSSYFPPHQALVSWILVV